MSAHHPARPQVAHAPDAGGAVGGAPTPSQTNTQNAAAGQSIVSGTDPVTQQYQAIFQQQMEQQAKLYGDITKLNDLKNQQSSYLSEAKSVSEMV